MPFRLHTWRDDNMTIEEMTAAFSKYEKALIQHVRKRYNIVEDCRDVVYEAYNSALRGSEYKKVPKRLARNWWYYRVSDKADRFLRKQKTEAKKMLDYTHDPTAMEKWHVDLSEAEGMEVLEEYWEGLPRYAKSRLRQQWQEEGKEWLQFMYPKE
jgi:hypothetical protein